MDGLEAAWGVSLVVTLLTLPMGLLRLVALGPGGFERTRTMRISARFAVVVGLVALGCLVAFSVALVVR